MIIPTSVSATAQLQGGRHDRPVGDSDLLWIGRWRVRGKQDRWKDVSGQDPVGACRIAYSIWSEKRSVTLFATNTF